VGTIFWLGEQKSVKNNQDNQIQNITSQVDKRELLKLPQQVSAGYMTS